MVNRKNRNARYIKEFDVRSPVQLYPKQLYKVYGVRNSLKFNCPVGRTWKHMILTSGHEFNSQE